MVREFDARGEKAARRTSRLNALRVRKLREPTADGIPPKGECASIIPTRGHPFHRHEESILRHVQTDEPIPPYGTDPTTFKPSHEAVHTAIQGLEDTDCIMVV